MTNAPKPILHDVIAVEVLPGFKLRLRFDINEVRIYNMAPFLARAAGVFIPLRRIANFRRAYVAHGTVCWPGDVDLDPELLYRDSIPEQVETGHRIGVARGGDMPEELCSPIDQEWQSMPDVGLEVWPSYSADTAAWATSQAQALRNHDVENLDWEHLADEILDVAKAEERELGVRASGLITSLIKRDLMKIELGPAGVRLIHEQRKLVAMQVARHPSLQRCLSQDAWQSGCWSAAIVILGEQGYSVEGLPEELPREISTFLGASDSLADGA